MDIRRKTAIVLSVASWALIACLFAFSVIRIGPATTETDSIIRRAFADIWINEFAALTNGALLGVSFAVWVGSAVLGLAAAWFGKSRASVRKFLIVWALAALVASMVMLWLGPQTHQALESGRQHGLSSSIYLLAIATFGVSFLSHLFLIPAPTVALLFWGESKGIELDTPTKAENIP